MTETDPKQKAITEQTETDTATNGFYKGLRYTVIYLTFLCLLTLGLIVLDKLNLSRIKNLDKETVELARFLIDTSYNLIIWIYSLLVGSYIFKGKSGSQFFESASILIEKATEFYRAKAASKAMIKVDRKK